MSSDLSKEERIGIKTAVAEAAATTDVQNLLREDVKNSTTKVADTLENFKQVHAKLLVIDSKNIVKDKFAPRWKGLYDSFYKILDASKQLATDIAAAGTKFTGAMNNIVRIKNISATTRGKIATSTADMTVGFEGRSAQIVKDLDALDVGLSDIKALLDPKKFGEAEKVALTTEMTNIVAEISKIEDEIKGYDTEIASVSTSLGIGPVGMGIVTCFCPIAGGVLFAVAAKKKRDGESHIKELTGKKDAAQKKLDADKIKKSEIQVKLDNIAAARETLVDVSNRIGSIRESMKFFKGIWDTIRGEAQKIATWLNSPDFKDNGLMNEPEIFIGLGGDAKKYYEFLSDACSTYATGLGNYTKPADV